MNASITTDAPDRTAPLALWRVAEAFMHILFNLFGGPEQVAAQDTLMRGPHALLASWLRTGEALMRRLLIIEASAYPKPNRRPLLLPKRQRARKLRCFTPEEPQKWRVSFRCFVGDTHARRTAEPAGRKTESACVSPAKRFYSAWPLAERYEAVSWRI